MNRPSALIRAIINRSLVYGILTLTLALVYFGLVIVLQFLFGRFFHYSSALVLVASTLAIAALFLPLRRLIQRAIDKRFKSQKPTVSPKKTVMSTPQVRAGQIQLAEQPTTEVRAKEMANTVSQQLGNYRLLRLIGRGGFAEVYLGEHMYLGTQAALKVLRTQIASDDIEKFREEGSIIARLDHPNIVRVLEFGIEGNAPFLVMDYAPNGNLRQRHPKGIPIPSATIVPYVKQIAAALQYAHDQKLIHRDIKPENMLLGRNNEILLSDFGLAVIAQSTESLATRDMAGTIPYMSPEQLQGKPRPASDQYSLGTVVYEWLSGERPFQGSFFEIASQQMLNYPPPLHDKIPTIPPALEEVVLRALAKDPHERFGRIEDFAWALEQATPTTQLNPDASPSPFPPSSTFSQFTGTVPALDKSSGSTIVMASSELPQPPDANTSQG